jgi:hypothetical protein
MIKSYLTNLHIFFYKYGWQQHTDHVDVVRNSHFSRKICHKQKRVNGLSTTCCIINYNAL